MPFGVNPFSKHDHHEFPGVVVPINTAPAHSKIDQEKKVGADEKTDAGSIDRSSSAENGSIHSHHQSQDGHLTLEILRAEVDKDVVASGQDSAYDRTLRFLSLFHGGDSFASEIPFSFTPVSGLI